MTVIKDRLRWLPNFVRKFGVISGLRLLFGNVAKWPFKSENVRVYTVPGFSHGIYMRDSIGDHATFRQCLVQDQYDFNSFPHSARLLSDYQCAISSGNVPLIIDCGANIGFATLWFAKMFPDAIIVCLEPDEDNFAVLTMNTNHLGDRVVRLKGGIWNVPAKLGISNPDAGPASYQLKELDVSGEEGLRGYTIDEICMSQGVESAFIVKLDIEGAQSYLFRSNTDWVPKTGLITLELDDCRMPWKGTSQSFFQCLSQYPFEYLLGQESIFCFRDFSRHNNTC